MLSQGSRHRAGHIYAVHKGAGSDKVWFMLSRGTGIEQRLQGLSQLSRHSADQKRAVGAVTGEQAQSRPSLC